MFVPVDSKTYHAVLERFASAGGGSLPTVSAEVPRDRGDIAIIPYLRGTGEMLGAQFAGIAPSVKSPDTRYIIESSHLTPDEMKAATEEVRREAYKVVSGSVIEETHDERVGYDFDKKADRG